MFPQLIGTEQDILIQPDRVEQLQRDFLEAGIRTSQTGVVKARFNQVLQPLKQIPNVAILKLTSPEEVDRADLVNTINRLRDQYNSGNTDIA